MAPVARHGPVGKSRRRADRGAVQTVCSGYEQRTRWVHGHSRLVPPVACSAAAD